MVWGRGENREADNRKWRENTRKRPIKKKNTSEEALKAAERSKTLTCTHMVQDGSQAKHLLLREHMEDHGCASFLFHQISLITFYPGGEIRRGVP